jgi:hypothetical protein
MATPALDRETILRAIGTWPYEEQLALAQEITRRAATSTSATHASIGDARGMLATPNKPAPSDEDIERLRMEKYGY